jgi:hypothetical protein
MVLIALYDVHRTFGTMLVVLSDDKEQSMSSPSAPEPPKRPPFRRVVVFTGRAN